MAVSKATVLNALGNFKTLQDTANGKKFVAQEEGKGLSTNDFTDEYREKLDELENYELPTASQWQKGGVRILADSGLAMSGDALIVTIEGGGSGTSDYQLPTASTTQKGGIKIGSGLEMQGDTLNCTVSSGTLDLVTQTQNGLMRATDKKKLDELADNAQENVIEAIWVDNTPQIVEGKIAKLNLNTYAKKNEVASGIRMKGSVVSFSDLPANAEVGDLYNIQTAGGVDGEGVEIQAGDNVVFTDKGTWDVMAGFIDLSDFAKKSDLAGAITQINSLSLAVNKFSNYELPPATASELGGIKVGNGFEIKNDGTLNCTVKGETYSEFTGATSSASGSKGLVPAPKSSDQKNFLCGDGTWADPSRFVHVVIGGGDSATASSSSVSTIQGGLWQDLINGVPCLKLRYGDYEYNFYYDTTNRVGGADTPLDTTTKGVEYVLSTVPSSQEGQLWYEVNNNVPTLMIHKWAYNYGFNYDTITYKGSNSYLWSYMPFESTLDDAIGNISWTKTGTPTVETSPAGGKALRNTGGFRAGNATGKSAFTIDFWLYLDLDKFPSNTTTYTLFTETGYTNGGSGTTTHALAVKNKVLTFGGNDISYISKKRTHIAMTRAATGSSTYKALVAYINGERIGAFAATNEIPSFAFFATATTDYPAYIDHFRLFKGQVVWNGDFTPPVAEDYLK